MWPVGDLKQPQQEISLSSSGTVVTRPPEHDSVLSCGAREHVESRPVSGALKRSGLQSWIGADGCLMCTSTPSYFCKCDGDARNSDTHPMALVLKYPR